MTRPATTRRGMLAATGATLLAGCSALDPNGGDEETIRASRLDRIVRDRPEAPVVADSLPVEIERSALSGSVQRVNELLADLPIPFGPESVPNGYIRHRLTDAANTASDRVAEARTAPSRFVALDRLQWARSEARYAAAGWAYADQGLTESELWSDHQMIVSEAESVREDIVYLGDDPVTAALVYGQVERFLESIIDSSRTPGHWASSQLLTVAEWGEHVESAQANLDDASYLYAGFQDSLSDGAPSVDGSLSAATEPLTAELRSRREDLPPEPTDEERRVRWRLQDLVRDDAESSVERVENAPGPASALLTATQGLTALLAHDRLTELIEAGEQFRPETAGEVQDQRTTAIDAITTALDESPRADLARPLLAEAARSVGYADDRLSEFRGDVRPARLDDVVARYVAATLRARSVPPACRTVLDALDG